MFSLVYKPLWPRSRGQSFGYNHRSQVISRSNNELFRCKQKFLNNVLSLLKVTDPFNLDTLLNCADIKLGLSLYYINQLVSSSYECWCLIWSGDVTVRRRSAETRYSLLTRNLPYWWPDKHCLWSRFVILIHEWRRSSYYIKPLTDKHWVVLCCLPDLWRLLPFYNKYTELPESGDATQIHWFTGNSQRYPRA